jgi:hypothetical protein
VGEELVVVLPVDLDRDPVGPRPDRPLTAERDAGLEQHGATGAGAGLRESLRLHHAAGDPGVDEGLGQPGGRLVGERVQVRSAVGPRERRTLLDRVERAPPVQVGGVHGVACRPELVGERDDPRGQALDVVEEEDISHGGDATAGSGRSATATSGNVRQRQQAAPTDIPTRQ